MNITKMSDVHQIKEVEHALLAIKRGLVVLYPSDTLWAITCDITNKAAVQRVQKIKNSKTQGEMILAVSSIEMLKEYVISIHPRIETLLTYHQKPLSIIYDTPHNIPEHLISKEGTVAIRVVKDEISKSIIDALDQPILSTTASPQASQVFPATYDEIPTIIKEEVDHIMHVYPASMEGLPSILATYNRKGDLEFKRT